SRSRRRPSSRSSSSGTTATAENEGSGPSVSEPALRPVVERAQLVEQLAAGGRQRVAGVRLLDDAPRDELAQAGGEDRGGDLVAALAQAPVGDRVVAQLPQHAQRPAAAEEVEQVGDGVAVLDRHASILEP